MRIATILCVSLLMTTPAFAYDIGATVADFTVKCTAGMEHSLAGWLGTAEKPGQYKYVVLTFWNDQCPWSRAADPYFQKLADTYKDKGVLVVGVCSNKKDHRDYRSDEQVKSYCADNKLTYAIVRDEDGALARAFGATKTPDVFVIDGKYALIYTGAPMPQADLEAFKAGKAFDDHVANALEEAMAGKPVTHTKTKSWGCSIKNQLKP